MRQEFLTGFHGLPRSVQALTSRTLKSVLDAPIENQRAWVTRIRAARILAKKREEARKATETQRNQGRSKRQAKKAREQRQEQAQQSFMRSWVLTNTRKTNI